MSVQDNRDAMVGGHSAANYLLSQLINKKKVFLILMNPISGFVYPKK